MRHAKQTFDFLIVWLPKFESKFFYGFFFGGDVFFFSLPSILYSVHFHLFRITFAAICNNKD